MHSSNPVFTRSDSFNGRGGQAHDGYGSTATRDPSTWSVGAPGQPSARPSAPPTAPVGTGRISIDSVVQKTAITLFVLVASAATTWIMIGEIGGSSQEALDNLGRAQALMLLGALGGFALAMVNSFKRVVSPPLVIAYAVCRVSRSARCPRSSRPGTTTWWSVP